jgi:hypothetical protein
MTHTDLLTWVKSGRCDTANCVEATAIGDETVAIRSSLATQDTLRVTRDEWAAFLIAVKAGDFDTV